MIFKRHAEPLSEVEIEEVQRHARDHQRSWAKRFAYSVALLLISCAAVLPFSAGHSLHAHAEPFGRLLVWLSVGLLLLCTYCAVMTVMSWVALREVLQEDARDRSSQGNTSRRVRVAGLPRRLYNPCWTLGKSLGFVNRRAVRGSAGCRFLVCI